MNKRRLPSEIAILRTLEKYGGPLEILEHMRIDDEDTAEVLERIYELEARSLVKIMIHETVEERKFEVEITELGKAYLNKISKKGL